MSENTALSVIEMTPPAQILNTRASKNYRLGICDRQLELCRDVDFGVIPGTKTPSLLKPGAEKIIWNYGLESRYELEKAIEDYEAGFFFYRFRCELWKNGVHITDGYGSSNSRERKNGSASGFDVANTALKIAKKRALVDAAILVGQLSGMFTQDIENEVFTSKADAYAVKDPNAKISSAQRTFFYAVASSNGYTKTEAKDFLAKHGYKSAADITVGALDGLCEALREGKAVEVEVIE
jgi:hypothetical protein